MEPILNLIREKTKISYDAALQISLLTSSYGAWTEAIENHFSFETLRFFNYSYRERGMFVTDSSRKKSSIYHVYESLTFYNDMIGSSGYNPKIPPDPKVDKDSLPFDLCTRLGKMHI